MRDIATYARIGLTDEELAQMTVDLNSIIETLKPITEFDLESVDPTFHPIGGLSNVMREDVAVKSNEREALLKNAPDTEGGLIKVPAIMDDESEDGE